LEIIATGEEGSCVISEIDKMGDVSTLCNFNSIYVPVVLVKCCVETMAPSSLLLLDCAEWQPWPPPIQVQTAVIDVILRLLG
jgi:hypothetical protein